jgi:hypothetical protein
MACGLYVNSIASFFERSLAFLMQPTIICNTVRKAAFAGITKLGKGLSMKLTLKLLASSVVLALASLPGALSAAIGPQSTALDIVAGLKQNSDLRQVPTWFKGGVSVATLINGVAQVGGKEMVLKVICPLVKVGADTKRVTKAAILAGATPSKVVDEASCDGALRNELLAAAIEAGADPTELTDSTAAGPQPPSSPPTPITPTPPGGPGNRVSPS